MTQCELKFIHFLFLMRYQMRLEHDINEQNESQNEKSKYSKSHARFNI